MITAGVDVGSVTTKAAVYDTVTRKVVGTARQLTGWEPRQAGEQVLAHALQAAGLSQGEPGYIIATGYGRVILPFADETVTEISCHARGAHFNCPTVRTVIDIGGQDSKVIGVDEAGYPRDFAMNDKCAAGTGRFLEVMARALGVQVPELGALAGESRAPAQVSSVCTVFAESEVVGLIADGAGRADIAAGLCQATASRVMALISQVGLHRDVLLTGGVALNDGVAAALERALGAPVLRQGDPQLAGAVGAAVLGAERVSGHA